MRKIKNRVYDGVKRGYYVSAVSGKRWGMLNEINARVSKWMVLHVTLGSYEQGTRLI